MSKEELIQKYLEGCLDEHGADELDRLLEADPALMDSLCEDIAFDARLRAYWKQQADQRRALDDRARRAVESAVMLEDADSKREKPTAASRKRAPERHTGTKAVIVLAILILFVFQIYREFVPLVERELPGEIETASLNLTGKVTSVADPVFALEHASFKPEQLLENDRIILESGLIELELVNKARIVLEGPADFQINSPMKLLCNSGRLSVFVPPEATRLEVATPRMTVRDIGTEFVVDVTGDDSSVHVVRGKVDANWFNAAWTAFESGEALKVDVDNKPLRFPAIFDLFVTSPEMKRRETAYRQKKRERREQLQQKWDGDTSLLYRFDPDQAAKDNAGCRLTDGPAEGVSAAVVSRKNTSIPLSIVSKPRSLTLFSTFRPDALRRGCNALFMARNNRAGAPDSTEAGKVYWQLSGRGTIQLMIGKEGSDVPDEYESPPVFSKKNLQTWTCLATTLDAEARTITFYMDGRIVGRLPMKETPDLNLSSADIGNWQRLFSSTTDVRFKGRIAELYVFNRPLSVDEIRDLACP